MGFTSNPHVEATKPKGRRMYVRRNGEVTQEDVTMRDFRKGGYAPSFSEISSALHSAFLGTVDMQHLNELAAIGSKHHDRAEAYAIEVLINKSATKDEYLSLIHI